MFTITNHQETQIKTAMRYQLTSVKMAFIKKTKLMDAGKDVEKRELSYTVGGNVNQYNHRGEQYGGPQKLKLELPHDLAISLMDIYPK